MKRTKTLLLTIHPTALLRTPKFPLSGELKDCWEALKVSISQSSTEFYDLINELDYEGLQQAPAQIQYTVWKYFNRSKYRATPFGSFAGVGILDIVSSPSSIPITVASAQHLHRFCNWSEISQVDPFIGNLDELKFFTNSSYYIFLDSIRYLTRFNSEHQLSEIGSDPLILTVLKLCSTPVSFQTIREGLRAGISGKSVEDLLIDLVDVQLLYTCRQPNIIGREYFKRVDFSGGNLSSDYIIAQREVINGGLHKSQLRHLPQLISKLGGLLSPARASALDEFISRFRRKFGEEHVPIMRALDPELGVGYGHLEQVNQTIDLIFSSSKKAMYRSTDLEDLKSELLRKIVSDQPEVQPVIDLEQLVPKDDPKGYVLPNSITVLASPGDDGLQVESIGGCTANAILGRFSLCGNKFSGLCKEIADIEQNANPDVLFFDIGYAGEPKIDNINRRASIYDYQLNLLNYDTSSNPLVLDDIFLLVRGNELLLYSHKLKKRLIPRITSAYNYTRSDLAVFRLMCDLQHQGIQTDLNLNLQSFLPDMDYYPRVKFKNIMISPAAWKVNLQDLTGRVDCVRSLRNYLEKLGISGFFKVGDTDQTLCFDTQNSDDLLSFGSHLQKQKSFYLKEAWTGSYAQDSLGRPYHNQLVLSMTHQQKLYDGIDFDMETQTVPKGETYFPPGGKWLYYQIYCHPSRAENLLLGVVGPLLLEFRNIIEKWFFIRYDQNGHHIRLRIFLKDINIGMQLTARLSVMLGSYLTSGTVSEFLLGTYKQEIQRYGKDNIDQVEAHFCVGSELVLFLASMELDTFSKYRICSRIFEMVRKSGIFSFEEFADLIESVCDSFVLEFQVASADFKRLNDVDQKLLQISLPILDESQQQIFDFYCCSLLETLRYCEEQRRTQLFSDLMHMQINRMFTDNQRSHELIIYYSLSKTSKRESNKYARV